MSSLAPLFVAAVSALADPGGRPSAMGNAYSALADDAYAPDINPGGLGFLKSPEASLQTLGRAQATGVLPVFGGRHGLGVSAEEDRYGVAYGARAAPGFSLGGTARFGTQPSADLGGLYRLQDDLSLGVVAQGIGGGFTPRLGVGWGPVQNGVFSLEWFHKDHDGGVRAGFEWRAFGTVLLRGGVDTAGNRESSNKLGLTAGLGYDLGFTELNYAYTRDRQALAAVVRFGTRLGETPRTEERTGPGGFRSNESGPPTLYQAVPTN